MKRSASAGLFSFAFRLIAVSRQSPSKTLGLHCLIVSVNYLKTNKFLDPAARIAYSTLKTASQPLCGKPAFRTSQPASRPPALRSNQPAFQPANVTGRQPAAARQPRPCRSASRLPAGPDARQFASPAPADHPANRDTASPAQSVPTKPATSPDYGLPDFRNDAPDSGVRHPRHGGNDRRPDACRHTSGSRRRHDRAARRAPAFAGSAPPRRFRRRRP